MLRRNPVPVYLLLTGANSLFSSMIFIAAGAYYVQTVGLDALQLVLVGTAVEVTIFLFEIPTGVVADVYSRRLSVIIGQALIGACFVIQGFIPVFVALIIAEIVRGLGETFVSGALSAWITDEVGEEKVGSVFIRASQVGQVGGLLGLAAGVGLSLLQPGLPIWLGGLGLMSMAVVLILVMPETGFVPTPKAERNTWGTMADTLRGGVQVMRTRPMARTIIAVGLITGLYSEGFDRLWEAHLIRNIGFPWFGAVVWFGLINVVGIVLSLIVTEIVKRKADLSQQSAIVRLLMFINIAQAGGILVLALSGNLALALAGLWISRLARGTTDPITETWINQNVDSKVRATVLSFSSQLDALGQFIGGPVLGYIGTTVSIPAALVVSALTLSTVSLLYGAALRRGPNLPARQEV